MKTRATPGAQPTLAGLPHFLRYLSTFPRSQELLEAMFGGPLARLDARIGQLYQRQGDELVSVAYVGPAASVGDRYTVLPLGVDMPLTRAAHANSVSPVGIESFMSELFLDMDKDLWDEVLARIPVQTIVNVPLTHAGTLVGALGFAMTRPWDDEGLDPVIVRALRGPLAVWVTHPSTGLAEAPASVREWSLTLTGRQVETLRRVRAGVPGSQIAAELGVSASTVKQDLLRAMKAMRTTDRMVAAERAESLGLL